MGEHTGEQLLDLLMQIVARLDHLGLDGEVRVIVHTSGGAITIEGKSAKNVANAERLA